MEKVNLSILVPAYNEERNITAVLQSIAKSFFPKDIHREVFVLTNGCKDQTIKFSKQFMAKQVNNSITWQVLKTKRANKPRALNFGLDWAKSGIVINVDADCRVHKNCLFKIFRELTAKPKLKLVGALDIPGFSGRDKKTLLYQFQRVQQIWREERGRVLPVGRTMGYKRTSFDKFPETPHSEDTWLALAMATKFGWASVKVLTEAIVYFIPPLNWLDYLRQESIYEAGYSQVMDLYPELEQAYKTRRNNFISKSPKEIDRAILARIKKENIPTIRLKELRGIIDPIKIENSQMMKSLLIDTEGNWSPVNSTKDFEK